MLKLISTAELELKGRGVGSSPSLDPPLGWEEGRECTLAEHVQGFQVCVCVCVYV